LVEHHGSSTGQVLHTKLEIVRTPPGVRSHDEKKDAIDRKEIPPIHRIHHLALVPARQRSGEQRLVERIVLRVEETRRYLINA
jgi:hypothetical protein